MTPNPTTTTTAIGRFPRADVRNDSGRADVLTGRSVVGRFDAMTSRLAGERPTLNRAIFATVVTTDAANGFRRSGGAR